MHTVARLIKPYYKNYRETRYKGSKFLKFNENLYIYKCTTVNKVKKRFNDL